MHAYLKKYRKHLTHFIFWFGFFMVFVFFWSARLEWLDAFLKSIVVTALEATVAYVNLWILLPKYFMKKNYFVFSFFSILIVIASVVILQFVSPLPNKENIMPNRGRWQQEQRIQKDSSQYSNNNENPPHRRFRKRPPKPRAEILMHLARQARNLFNAVLTIGVILISTAIGVSQIAFKKEKEATLYKSEKIKAEMRFLKSQINPHFLFNALNSAYTLAYIKAEEAPEVILRISDMLRYLIYECEEDKVPLEKEITYIKNYIAIQKTRLEKPENVRVTWEINNVKATNENSEENISMKGLPMVAPMIFIPFIENSFKHSHIENTETGTIKLVFKLVENTILFSLVNSLPKASFTKDKVGGIGLENVKQRLEFLYPKKHHLNIIQSESQFSVTLKLELA